MATHYLNFDAATNGTGAVGSPWNSFASAQAGIARGDTVMVSGTLRGSMVFDPAKGGTSSSAKTKWLGASDNFFVVTGGEPLTGWSQCTAADEAVVGPNYASIWKTTKATSIFPGSNPLSANICEAGAQIPICVERAQTFDAFFITKPQYYHTADSVTLSGANITGFKKPSVTDNFTEAQIEASTVLFVRDPNVAASSAVSNFDPVTKVISLASPATYEDSAVKDNFALQNLLPAMKRGEWGYRTSGGNTTLYCWPNNVGNLAGAMEYSARATGINLNGTSNLEIGYFKTRQTAGNIGNSGNLYNGGGACSHVHIHHFESTDMLNYGGAQAAVYLNLVHDLTLEYGDIRRAQGLFGVFLQGAGASNADAGNPQLVTLMQRAHVHELTIAFTSSGPIRTYTLGNSVIHHCIFWECARQSHGNTMNAYQSSYNCLWYGIDGQDADGFFTWQESDSILIMCCSASASRAPSGGARSIYQQQNAVAKQGSVYGYKLPGVINCRGVPWGGGGKLGSTNALRAASSAVPLDKPRVRNNVYHGHSGMKTGDWAVVQEWANNIITAGSLPPSPWSASGNELVDATILYVDAANDDFRYPAGSRARTKAGISCTDITSTLAARFPHVPASIWTVDMVGDAIDWSNPPMGPTVDPDAVMGQARNITYAGAPASPGGGGGGTPSRPVFAQGFKIKRAA